MTTTTVQIDRKLTADIDDPDRADWHGSLCDAAHLCEGDVTVVVLDPGDRRISAARARVVPIGPDQPAALEGLEAFA